MVLFTLAIGVIWYRGLRALWRIRKYPNPYFLLLSYHLCFLSMTLFSIFDVTLTEARVNLVAWLSLSVIYAGTTLSQQLKAPS
jgi:steroid 5-alpha reductase family enzyme